MDSKSEDVSYGTVPDSSNLHTDVFADKTKNSWARVHRSTRQKDSNPGCILVVRRDRSGPHIHVHKALVRQRDVPRIRRPGLMQSRNYRLLCLRWPERLKDSSHEVQPLCTPKYPVSNVRSTPTISQYQDMHRHAEVRYLRQTDSRRPARTPRGKRPLVFN